MVEYMPSIQENLGSMPRGGVWKKGGRKRNRKRRDGGKEKSTKLVILPILPFGQIT